MACLGLLWRLYNDRRVVDVVILDIVCAHIMHILKAADQVVILTYPDRYLMVAASIAPTTNATMTNHIVFARTAYLLQLTLLWVSSDIQSPIWNPSGRSPFCFNASHCSGAIEMLRSNPVCSVMDLGMILHTGPPGDPSALK